MDRQPGADTAHSMTLPVTANCVNDLPEKTKAEICRLADSVSGASAHFETEVANPRDFKVA
jgi:hypothetical protein